MSARQTGIEDAVFEEVSEVTFEVWSLPFEGSPARQAAYGIATLEQAWELTDQLGGDTMFQVRDSKGAWHYRVSANPDFGGQWEPQPSPASSDVSGSTQNAEGSRGAEYGVRQIRERIFKSDGWKNIKCLYGGVTLTIGAGYFWYYMLYILFYDGIASGEDEISPEIAATVAVIWTAIHFIRNLKNGDQR